MTAMRMRVCKCIIRLLRSLSRCYWQRIKFFIYDMYMYLLHVANVRLVIKKKSRESKFVFKVNYDAGKLYL